MPQAGAIKINNLDISTLAEKLDRMAVEVAKSVSAGLGEYNQFDKARLQSFINDARAFIAYSSSVNDVDLPHSHPVLFEIKEPSVSLQPELENEAANQLCAEIIRARENIIQSQSSVRAAGWMAHDLVRINSYVDRLDSYLNMYIETILPVDKPETFARQT